jgi:hypothetical protein
MDIFRLLEQMNYQTLIGEEVKKAVKLHANLSIDIPQGYRLWWVISTSFQFMGQIISKTEDPQIAWRQMNHFTDRQIYERVKPLLRLL